jgi:hypothetical protein
MDSVRLDTLLEPKDEVEKARYDLLRLVMNAQASTVRLKPKTSHKWDKPYCKRLFTEWNELFPSNLDDNWLDNISAGGVDKEHQGAEKRWREYVSLVEAVYGVRFAWILARFPSRHWYFHQKRLPACANVVVTLITFAEDALDAAPTANATLSHASPTEHVTSMPAAVDKTSDQYQREEKTRINEELNNIQPSQVTTACEQENNEVQASVAPLSVPVGSSSRPAKRSLMDCDDESGSGHFGIGISEGQFSQHAETKRVRRAAEQISKDSSTITLPLDDGNTIGTPLSKWIGTPTRTSSLLSTAQYATGNDSFYYLQPIGNLSVELLHPMLLQRMTSAPRSHFLSSLDALSFVTEAAISGFIPCEEFATYYSLHMSWREPGFQRLLEIYVPEIQNADEAAKTVQFVVVLPKDLASFSSILLISAPQLPIRKDHSSI